MRTLKIIFFGLTLLCSAYGFAQGSLQFSQAKLVTALETVPTGKVWKVLSFLPTQVYRSDYSPAPRIYTVTINGVNRDIGFSGIGDANSKYSDGMSFVDLPLWLPESTTLNPVVSGGYIWAANVIEFNIIP